MHDNLTPNLHKNLPAIFQARAEYRDRSHIDSPETWRYFETVARSPLSKSRPYIGLSSSGHKTKRSTPARRPDAGDNFGAPNIRKPRIRQWRLRHCNRHQARRLYATPAGKALRERKNDNMRASATRRVHRSVKRRCTRPGKPLGSRRVKYRHQTGITGIPTRANTPPRGAHTLRNNDVMFEQDDSVIVAAYEDTVGGTLVNVYFTNSTHAEVQPMYCIITWVT